MRSPKILVPLALAAVVASSLTSFPAHTASSQELPLIKAVEKGDHDAIRAMIESGVDLDAAGTFGATALMRASYRGDTRMLMLLLEVGADSNLADAGGATALHVAARRGHDTIAGMLLDAGAKVNVQDKEGWTPLMRAAISKRTGIMNRLLKSDADVNIPNSQGETALMFAISSGESEAVRLLLERNADLEAKTRYGESVADIANRTQAPAIHTLLEKYRKQSQQTTQESKAEEKPAPVVSLPEIDTPAEPEPVTVPKQVVMKPEVPIVQKEKPVEVSKAVIQQPEPVAPEVAVQSPDGQLPERKVVKPEATAVPATDLPNVKTVKKALPSPPKAERFEISELDDIPKPAVRVESRPLAQTVNMETPEDVPWVVRVPESNKKPVAPSVRKTTAPATVKEQPTALPWLGSVGEPGAAPVPAPVAKSRPVQKPVVPVVPPLKQERVSDDKPKPPVSAAPARSQEIAAATIRSAPATELVEVGEAIYVPPQQEVIQDTATPLIRNKRPVWGLLPSQQGAGKQLWLQLASFPSREVAVNFWQNLRRMAPEAVNQAYRMRLTRPYGNWAANPDQVAMRIGPVSGNRRGQYICEAARRLSRNLYCNTVREFGKTLSSSAGGRQAASGNNRYQRYGLRGPRYQNNIRGSLTSFWLQVGSYTDLTAAESYLRSLKKMHPELLDDLKAEIGNPPNSSARMRTYRLQFGPFGGGDEAMKRCNALRAKNVSCLVVRNRS